MAKAWDILPPRKRPRKNTRPRISKKTSQTGTFIFGLLVLIFLAVFFFGTTNNTSQNIDGVATKNTLTPSPSPTIKNPEELLIKILNGSGKSEEIDTVKESLSEAGFPIAKTENALNLYPTSIIYYEPNQESLAQEIAKKIEKYTPELVPFSQDSPYDMIIVIGAR